MRKEKEMFEKKRIEKAKEEFIDWWGEDVIPEQFNLQKYRCEETGREWFECEFHESNTCWHTCTRWEEDIEVVRKIFESLDPSLIDIDLWQEEHTEVISST